jgi:hypothetical protein
MSQDGTVHHCHQVSPYFTIEQPEIESRFELKLSNGKDPTLIEEADRQAHDARQCQSQLLLPALPPKAL